MIRAAVTFAKVCGRIKELLRPLPNSVGNFKLSAKYSQQWFFTV